MYVDDPDVFQVWIAPTDPPESGSGQAFIFVATPEAPE
jgi:hypothetical protein